MAYKDPDKQREANAERQRRYRAERGKKAYPKGVTGRDGQGVTDERTYENSVLCEPISTNPKRSYIGAVLETPDTTIPKMIQDVSANGGEYSFKTVKGKVQDVRHTKPKRGKDIKCFEDLPVDVKLIINRLSVDDDGKIDPIIKANRTAIAVNYQHQFPDRYHSTGISPVSG